MNSFGSPLRYPGGKGGLTPLLAKIMELNGLQDPIYVEPYAGGAGAALNLLLSERVSEIWINDLDKRVYSLWMAMLTKTDDFLEHLAKVPVTLAEWRKQRLIYLQPEGHDVLAVGFATFFLNRCNRSGILASGGPIGGKTQAGKWKLDARFNRVDLQRRIETIALYGDRIRVSNLDALVFLEPITESSAPNIFFYLDPPYYKKGPDLYLNSYQPEDHERVAQFIKQRLGSLWILSYDNVPEIKRLYEGFPSMPLNLAYTSHIRRSGSELLIFPPDLILPKSVGEWVAARNRATKPACLDTPRRTCATGA